MITEFMQGGDLRRALEADKAPRCLSWYKKGRSIALGLAQSLAYLHSQSVRRHLSPSCATCCMHIVLACTAVNLYVENVLTGLHYLLAVADIANRPILSVYLNERGIQMQEALG